jgi:membrane protease YdiL (CAAX protease family)
MSADALRAICCVLHDSIDVHGPEGYEGPGDGRARRRHGDPSSSSRSRAVVNVPVGPLNSSNAPVVGPGAQDVSNDGLSRELRGFGPLGIIAILAILLTGNVVVGPMIAIPVGATLVLLWARLSRTPWQEIGYVRPRSWPRTIALGVVFGIALKLLMKIIVMPLLGAPPVNQSYHFLAGNVAFLPGAIWSMLNAGFAEETVFRGYMFERLRKLCGTGVVAKTSIVLITSTLFGVAHYTTQGLAGVEQALVVGLVLGSIYVVTGRLVLLMFTHAAFDLTALAMIYADVEISVAHLVFR